MSIPSSEYLTLSQAATLLGVSASTLRTWVRTGRFAPPRHAINGHCAYVRSEIFRSQGVPPPFANGNGVAAESSRQLRPFFGYYGGKWRDALKHYPPPRFETIIEPFAGSAGYSMRYPNRRVILCEIDAAIAEVWRYLIRVKPKEILSIPDLPPGGTVDDLKIPQEAKWLVGLWLNRGIAHPRKSPSKWMRDGIRPGSFWGKRVKETIAGQVEAIRHWKVLNVSYEECPTLRKKSTWFIDPPYQVAGGHYRYGSEHIDYLHLAAWCRSRPGQVLVCENAGATWLPFRVLADVKTTRAKYRSKEVFWLNDFEADGRSGGKRG